MAASPQSFKPHGATSSQRVNIDLIAITIALALAALIRLNILPHIGF